MRCRCNSRRRRPHNWAESARVHSTGGQRFVPGSNGSNDCMAAVRPAGPGSRFGRGKILA
jgi:hypothetical protein